MSEIFMTWEKQDKDGKNVIWVGYIEKTKKWDRALTDEEITELYNKQKQEVLWTT